VAKSRPKPADPPSLGEAELAALRVLWKRTGATAREVHDQLTAAGRDWAYTTVLTLLHRLEAKGFIASDKANVAHVFRAVVTRQRLLGDRLVGLSRELCDGLPLPLMNALVENHRFSSEEIAQFRALVDNLSPAKSPRKSRKSKD
jgi:predicted transcriptional regulator